MIQPFVEAWERNKAGIRKKFEAKHPADYKEIVEIVVRAIGSYDDAFTLDAEKIHEIDDGDCQGTLLYVIPEASYQPSRYYSVKVDYGSCSQCDTLLEIQNAGDMDYSPESQVNDYMTLALHIVQGMKEI